VSSVVGLDIGGSTTRGRLLVDGRLVRQASAGSASRTAVGEQRAQANLRSLLDALLDGHPRPPTAVCAGAAGSGAAPARAWLMDALTTLTGTARVLIVDDIELVLPAAGHAEGVAIVCGTGSIVHASGSGGRARAGGWGWLLSDEGGGYSLVRGALRILLTRRDAGEPAGALAPALLAATDCDSLDELIVAFHADPAPDRWAACAPAVIESTDPAVATLIQSGTRTLAAHAVSVARRISLDRSPIVLAGGLIEQAWVREALQAALAQALPGWPVEVLREAPVAGAVLLALRAAGARMT
jgi:N-acetylglucosamine kinase-like BadF-type ATPase